MTEVIAWLKAASEKAGIWDVVIHAHGVSIVRRLPDGTNEAVTLAREADAA